MSKQVKRPGVTEKTSDGVKKWKSWTFSLLDSMKDPDLIVKKSEVAVVIKDIYPKATLHYLILPYEDLSSIHKLTTSHIPLLKEFERLYVEVMNENPNLRLEAGFHAIPSMYRLHMHIISKDMISPSLKTKVHWNSFTTRNFIPLDEIVSELKLAGCIKKISQEEHRIMMATPLKCNQCPYAPKNMPDLKQHLLIHAPIS